MLGLILFFDFDLVYISLNLIKRDYCFCGCVFIYLFFLRLVVIFGIIGCYLHVVTYDVFKYGHLNQCFWYDLFQSRILEGINESLYSVLQ